MFFVHFNDLTINWLTAGTNIHKISNPDEAAKLESQDYNRACCQFFVVVGSRILICAAVASYLLYRRDDTCEPILSVVIYQDFFMTIMLQIWIYF